MFSQLALAIPLCFLYELGIILAKIIGKPYTDDQKKAMGDAEQERARDRADTDEKRIK